MDKKTALYIADLAMNRYEATLTIFVQDVIIRYLFNRLNIGRHSKNECLSHLERMIKLHSCEDYKEEEYTNVFNSIWDKHSWKCANEVHENEVKTVAHAQYEENKYEKMFQATWGKKEKEYEKMFQAIFGNKLKS